jgi:hypothetical protein
VIHWTLKTFCEHPKIDRVCAVIAPEHAQLFADATMGLLTRFHLVTQLLEEAGCVVEVRFDDDDDTITYLVGSIEERHDDFDVLSVSSPLGQAVLGASPGQQRAYEGPRGNELKVEVVAVRSAS